MPKTLILCADDFGQAPHISQAILALSEQKRLSAVSCMTIGQDWNQHGPLLKDFHSSVNIGLHFNLTWGQRNYPPSPLSWLLRALTGKVDRSFVKAQLTEQLDRFEEVTGFPPDFIDGHQHVHSFPIIRKVMFQIIKTRFPQEKPYIRALSPMLSSQDAFLKALIVRGAAFRFSQRLTLQGLRHNACFGGLYSLNETAPYRKYMQRWLQQAPTGTLLMCHPGKQALEGTVDPIQKARLEEYLYLLSPAFNEDCKAAGVVLGKFAETL